MSTTIKRSSNPTSNDDKTTTATATTSSSINTQDNMNQFQKRIYNTIPQIKETLRLIGYGIRDSMNLKYSVLRVYDSTVLKVNFINCIFLNGIIFLGTYLVYLYWVSPMISYLLYHFPALSNVFSIIYFSLWVYPVFIFSIIANSKWYTEIAKESFKVSGHQAVSSSNNGVLSSLVDEIYRNMLFFVIIAISFFMAFIPYTSFINFTLVTWLYSFYCFDYKWILRGKWSLLQRITYFETHWAYMFGYGFLFTAASFFFPLLIGNAVFSILYPLFIISAVISKPMKMTNTDGLLPKQIPIFFIPQKCVNVLLKFYVQYQNNRKQKSSSSPTSSSSSSTTATTPNSTK